MQLIVRKPTGHDVRLSGNSAAVNSQDNCVHKLQRIQELPRHWHKDHSKLKRAANTIHAWTYSIVVPSYIPEWKKNHMKHAFRFPRVLTLPPPHPTYSSRLDFTRLQFNAVIYPLIHSRTNISESCPSCWIALLYLVDPSSPMWACFNSHKINSNCIPSRLGQQAGCREIVYPGSYTSRIFHWQSFLPTEV